MKNEFITVNILRYPKLAKCSCCNRVRDIYYKAIIKEVDNQELIMGDLELCKNCGDNLHRALGNETNANEKIVKEFNFEI